MLRFSGNNEGRPVLGIGLTRENCERLLGGEAIHFDTAGLEGMPDIEVFLIAGDSDMAIAAEMWKQGANLPEIEGEEMKGGPVS